MKQFIFLIPCLIFSFVGAEIRTNEIVLRLGEVIDFDSGVTKIITIDTLPDTTWRTRPDDDWFATYHSFCRCSKSDQYDVGFFFNGSIVDCGGPPGLNCTESLKSIYSPDYIYKFTKFDFFAHLDNPVDTADKTFLLKYQMDDASFWNETATEVICSLSVGPQITILAGNQFFCGYYFLITDKGNGCIFTILKRDTVEGYCEFNRYNAIRVKYYLQTDGTMEFSSISGDIKKRIETGVTMNCRAPVYNNIKKDAPAAATIDLLGRFQCNKFNATTVYIQKTKTHNTRRNVAIK